MKYLQLFLMAELVANIAVVEELVQQFTIRGLADSEQACSAGLISYSVVWNVWNGGKAYVAEAPHNGLGPRV
jgi:hypothetical protein